MAEMLEDLQLQDGNRTLEIGAGTGYNAALLARAAGPVISVDVDNRVVEEARRHLQHFPDRAVHFVSGDGRSGWQSGAPYDRVVVTAASPDIQPAWISQTSEGGIIQVPLALAPGLAFIARGVARNGTFVGRLTRQAYFIALRSHDAAGDEVENESALPEPTVLEPVAAPWQDWCPRQPQQVALPFIRAIAFLGWLKGMSIGYRATREEGILFGIADPASDAVCWLGQRVWRVDGREGRAIGEHLWHLFLESGGPAPTEFMLSAATDRGRLAVLTDTALSFQRTGAFTEQLWELKRDRVRPIVD
jgi:protein-L-isoaspartate O-methyltransferase